MISKPAFECVWLISVFKRCLIYARWGFRRHQNSNATVWVIHRSFLMSNKLISKNKRKCFLPYTKQLNENNDLMSAVWRGKKYLKLTIHFAGESWILHTCFNSSFRKGKTMQIASSSRKKLSNCFCHCCKTICLRILPCLGFQMTDVKSGFHLTFARYKVSCVSTVNSLCETLFMYPISCRALPVMLSTCPAKKNFQSSVTPNVTTIIRQIIRKRVMIY